MNKNKGFTLIEVLIAMSLLSIMMLLLFGSLRISARNWDAGETKILEVSRIAAVQNFLLRFLPSVKPIWDDFSSDEAFFSFQGSSESLSFVNSLPASAGRFGLQFFSLKVNKEGQEQNIEVAIRPFYPVTEDEQWQGEDVTLISNISSLKLSYFGILEEDSDESDWHDNWIDQEQLPSLIKVEIEYETGIFWPAMIIATAVNEHQEFIENKNFSDNDGQSRGAPDRIGVGDG